MRGCACPASFRLRSGRAEAGELGAAPAVGGAAPAEPDGRASGRLLGELGLRRGGPPPPRLTPPQPPALGRPRNIRPSHREVEESPAEPPGGWGPASAPRVGEPCPASRHFLSENGARRGGRRRRRSGRASSRSGSCCLPARWGERRSCPRRGGRRAAAGRRTAKCTRRYTSGRRPAAGARAPRGFRRAGAPAEVPPGWCRQLC